MPKAITLHNQHIRVEKGTELDAKASDDAGPVIQEMWTIIFTDRTYGDQISVSFNKEARDQIVKDLMGGVILPSL